MWIFAAGMALIVQQDEWPGLPPLDGFVVGYQQTVGVQSIEERVPVGETVHDWSRMITTLRFGGRGDAKELIEALTPIWTSGCPGAVMTPVRRGEKAGLVSFQSRLDCPRNPRTRKPETFLLRAFGSRGTTHMVQVAFRHVPSEAEAAWAQSVLDGVVLCSAASAHPQCRR